MSGKKAVLPTLGDLQGWRKAEKRLLGEIESLELQLRGIRQMIEGAEMARGGKSTPSPRAPVVREVRKPAPKRQRVRSSHTDATWTSVMESIVNDAQNGIRYDILKAKIGETELADRIRASEKGFYGAISKLIDAKKAVKYKGHLFSPSAYKRFADALAAGEIADLQPAPNPAHRSQLGDAFLDIARHAPKVYESSELIKEARKIPELAEAINKNKTYAYNVLSRLVDQGKLVKIGKGYCAAEYAAQLGAATLPGMSEQDLKAVGIVPLHGSMYGSRA